jgi:hypothetical protein
MAERDLAAEINKIASFTAETFLIPAEAMMLATRLAMMVDLPALEQPLQRLLCADGSVEGLERIAFWVDTNRPYKGFRIDTLSIHMFEFPGADLDSARSLAQGVRAAAADPIKNAKPFSLIEAHHEADRVTACDEVILFLLRKHFSGKNGEFDLSAVKPGHEHFLAVTNSISVNHAN